MTKRTSWLITFIFILWLASACNQTPVDTTPPVPPITPTSEATEDVPPTPTLKPTQVPTATAVADPNPKTVLISHVLAGVEGNNNFDYIALYNNAGEPIDLRGYTLEYLPRPDADVETVYKWRTFTPFVSDFYVLTRDDEDFAAASDVVFEQQIFNRGSLALIDPDGNLVDLVGWGDVPEESYIGSPAPKLPRGSTLVRRLAPPFTTGSNADLFMVEAEAQLPGCFPENEALSISLPETVPPGNQFEVLITKSADSDINEIQFLIPAGFALAQGEPVSEATYIGVQTSDQQTVINLKAPTTLQQAILRGSTVVIDGAETCLPAQVVSVEGRLPIAVARNLLDETVTIEGTATMFTDGFFAGSSGTKFYIEDESGGVQVYVPGGKGGVNIQLGDMVRVTGKTEYYRTSLEVIPADFAVNIEVIGQADAQTAATLIDLDSAANDIGLNGRLISVNGTVESVEEFNFSYEIDLVDPDGNKLLVYIDKLTNMSVVDVEEGADYTITGISESWDGNIRLNPRVQADLARIWPEEILVEVSAPASVSVGPVEYEIEITNYTSETQTNILVTAPRPEGNIESIIVQTGETGVTATREIINWAIPKMEPGQSVTLRMSVSLSDSGQSDDGGADDRVFFFPVRASSDQTVEPVFSEDLAVFTSGILPIWAIQGSGDKSPYIGRTETTSGIITGIFPELDGMFLQSQDDDQNVSTSNGIFIYLDHISVPSSLERGMLINVNGLITERSGQTEVQVSDEDDITIISTTNLLDTIAASPLSPPAEEGALAYFEAREGMLVSLDSYAVAVGPTNRFGETPLFPVSLAEFLVSGAPLLYRGMEPLNDSIIFLDDGSFAAYTSGDELPLALSTGDVVSTVSGPLAFTFGNYKIEPADISQITIEPSTYADQQVEQRAEQEGNQFSIATFNVENLFDPFDPHPSSPDLPSLEEYDVKLSKLSSSIALMGFPNIIAVQEAENIDVLEDLAEMILSEADVRYTAHLLEGTDSRGIDVGYLTRESVVVESLTQWPAPEGVTSRDPLMLKGTIQTDSINQPIVLINNHFTSLAGGEENTLPRRIAQAEWNVGLVEQVQAENPEAAVVVLGDLNSFRGTDPLNVLEVPLNHVYDGLEQSDSVRLPYTYIFEGVAQSLDHILVSDNLFDLLVDAYALPINAEYPLQPLGDAGPFRSSDHNPLIAVFEFAE